MAQGSACVPTLSTAATDRWKLSFGSLFLNFGRALLGSLAKIRTAYLPLCYSHSSNELSRSFYFNIGWLHILKGVVCGLYCEKYKIGFEAFTRETVFSTRQCTHCCVFCIFLWVFQKTKMQISKNQNDEQEPTAIFILYFQHGGWNLDMIFILKKETLKAKIFC